MITENKSHENYQKLKIIIIKQNKYQCKQHQTKQKTKQKPINKTKN